MAGQLEVFTTKHTPLPWTVEDFSPYGGGSDASITCAIRHVAGTVVFLQQFQGNLFADQFEANARHIVRAANSHDELLAVAIASMHALRSYQYGNASQDLAEEVADKLQAAIRKAQGGAA